MYANVAVFKEVVIAGVVLYAWYRIAKDGQGIEVAELIDEGELKARLIVD